MAVLTNYTDLVLAEEIGPIRQLVDLTNANPFTKAQPILKDPFRVQPSGINGFSKQINIITRQALTGNSQAKHGVRAGSNVNAGLNFEYTMSMFTRFLPAIMYSKVVKGETEDMEATGITVTSTGTDPTIYTATVAFSALDSTQEAQLKANTIVYIHDQRNRGNTGWYVLTADAASNQIVCSPLRTPLASSASTNDNYIQPENLLTPVDSAPLGDKLIYVSTAGRRIPASEISSITTPQTGCGGRVRLTFSNAHQLAAQGFMEGSVATCGQPNPNDAADADIDERSYLNALTIAGATGDRAVRNGVNRGAGEFRLAALENTVADFDVPTDFLQTVGAENFAVNGNLDLLSGQFYRNVAGSESDSDITRFIAERTYPIIDDDGMFVEVGGQRMYMYKYTTGIQGAQMNFNLNLDSFINGGITFIGKNVFRVDTRPDKPYNGARVAGFETAVQPIYDDALSTTIDLASIRLTNSDDEDLMIYANSISANISNVLQPKRALGHRDAVRVNRGNFNAGINFDIEFEDFTPAEVVEINDKAKAGFSMQNPQGKVSVDMPSVQISLNQENNNPGSEITLPLSGQATGSNDLNTTIGVTKTYGPYSNGASCD